MDTSETYIKMCGQAREIQTIRITKGIQHFGMGDWVTKPNFETHGYVTPICLGIYDKIEQEGYGFMGRYLIWLPHQDQLQAMCYLPGRRFTIWLNEVDETKQLEWTGEASDYFVKGFSIEQLWLAFVMKENYNKIWDGKEWVKG